MTEIRGNGVKSMESNSSNLNTTSDLVGQQLSDLDKLLDEYEGKLGLPLHNHQLAGNETVNHLLGLSRGELEKYMPDQCNELAFILNQFCFHLQRQINREQARHNWADSTLNNKVGEKVGNYKGYSYQERASQAIAENSYLSKLLDIKTRIKQRIDRLSFLTNRLSGMADSLTEISRTKRSKKHE